jgi:hypothetical protein
MSPSTSRRYVATDKTVRDAAIKNASRGRHVLNRMGFVVRPTFPSLVTIPEAGSDEGPSRRSRDAKTARGRRSVVPLKFSCAFINRLLSRVPEITAGAFRGEFHQGSLRPWARRAVNSKRRSPSVVTGAPEYDSTFWRDRRAIRLRTSARDAAPRDEFGGVVGMKSACHDMTFTRRRYSRRDRKALNIEMAGGLGFEPRLAESESAVLPLDDPPNGRPA